MKVIGDIDFHTVRMHETFSKYFNISAKFSFRGVTISLVLQPAAKQHSAVYYCASSGAH